MIITKRKRPIKEIRNENEFLQFLQTKDSDIKRLSPEIKKWFQENKDASYPVSYFLKSLFKELYGKLPKSKMSVKYWTIRGYTNAEATQRAKEENEKMCEKSVQEMKSLSVEERKRRYNSSGKEYFKKKYGDKWESEYKKYNYKRTNNSFKNKIEYWINKGYTEKEAKEKVKEIQSTYAKISWEKSPRYLPSQKEYWMERGYSEEESLRKVSEAQKKFSLEICISKYGEELGRKIWEERNERWYQTLENTFIEKYGVRHYYFKKFRNKEDLNEEYIKRNFFKKYLDLQGMEEYFQVSRSFLIPELEKMGFKKEDFLKETQENEVLRYVLSIYNGEVISHDRKILEGKELDIFIPELNFAIEYNGLLFHSRGLSKSAKFHTPDFDKNYHFDKTQKCEEKGIHLFHIFENEWIDDKKRDIWKSKISIKLKAKNVTKINARDCEIREIGSKESFLFLEENHLQGGIHGSIRLGLFKDNELVSVFVVGKSRFKDEMELYRSCTKKYTIVRGGFSKMLKWYFNNNQEDLVSYGNRRWTCSLDNAYQKQGEIEGISGPNKFYFLEDYTLRSRQSFQKHKLKYILDNYYEKLTADENMMINGYRIIYDSGNLKYKLTRRNV